MFSLFAVQTSFESFSACRKAIEELHGWNAAAVWVHCNELQHPPSLHLPEVARHFGPLWGHSSFVFEGGNGRLVKLMTGASGVPLQIVERVVKQQQLKSFLASPLVSDSVTRLCRDMLGYAKLENALHVDDVCLLGYPCQITTPQEVKSALMGQVCPEMAMEYNKLAYKGHILHSTSYKTATRSNSSVVECDEDGRYFVITNIISVSKRAFSLCKKVVLAESGDFPCAHQRVLCFDGPSNVLWSHAM